MSRTQVVLLALGLVCILGAGGAEARADVPDFALTSYINIVSGVINDVSLSQTQQELHVGLGQKIAGQVRLQVRDDGGSQYVFSVIATPDWGDKTKCFWQVGGCGQGTCVMDTAVDLTAPDAPGVYYLIFVGAWDIGAANIASGTNWSAGAPVWNAGHDVADWPASKLEYAMAHGRALDTPCLLPAGIITRTVPANAIRIIVGGTAQHNQDYLVFDTTTLSRPVAIGDTVTILGTAYAASGSPLPLTTLGVDDGCASLCSPGPTTDSLGRFTYVTKAMMTGMCQVCFHLPDGASQSAWLNVSASSQTFAPTSLIVAGLALRNTTSKTLKAVITVGTLSHTVLLPPYTTSHTIATNPNLTHWITVPSPSWSCSPDLSLMAGPLTVTGSIDSSNVLTVDVAGGEVLAIHGYADVAVNDILAGHISAATLRDYGACGTLGGDVFIFAGEAGLCVGTDGMHVTGGASVGLVIGAGGSCSVKVSS